MSTASVADLVESLRKSRLLEAAQMEKVIKAQARFPDAVTLAKELVRRGWVTREQVQALLRGRSAAPAPAAESAAAEAIAAEAAPAAPAPPQTRRRSGAWLLALLALLLLVGGGGLAVWWRSGAGGSGSGNAGNTAQHTDPPPRAGCSDTSDLKVLDDLEFGDPVRAPFEPKFLDALRENKRIPEVEVYPWLPRDLIAILGEHRMRGTIMAASPDGTLVAVGGLDGFLRLGPLDTLHEQAVLPVPGGIYSLVWSPKGNVIASSGGDRTVRLWDVRNIEQVPEPVVLASDVGVTGLAFSGDGKYLIGGGSVVRTAPQPPTGMLFLWDLEQRKELYRKPQAAPVQGLAFSPVAGDYRLLWGGGPGDGNLHLWHGDKGEEIAALDFRFAKEDEVTYVGHVAIAPDGKLAVSGHAIKDPKANRTDVSAHVWDLAQFEKGKEKHVLPGAVNWRPLAAFAPDSKTLAVARLVDAGVGLVEVESGMQIRPTLTSGVSSSLMFLPHSEGKPDRIAFIGSTGLDYNVRIHEVPGGKELEAPIGHLAAVQAVAASPDGRHLVSGGYEGQVRAWDLDKVVERYVLGGGGQVWNVGFHPDASKAFFSSQGTSTPAFLDLETGKPWALPAWDNHHNGAVTNSAVTEDGHYALTGGYNDGTVRLWSLKNGKQVRYFGAGGAPATVALSPKGRRALRTSGTSLKLLHLRCQEERHEWTGGAWNTFLPDKGWVAILGGAASALWDISEYVPRPAGTIHLGLTGLSSGDISHNGERLGAVLGGRVGVWDLKAEKPLWEWTPPTHFGGVRAVALSSDGRYLATANGDGTVYVIQLAAIQ